MSKKVQMALRVYDEDSFNDLNEHLEGGWKVVFLSGMSSSGELGACLVIIEGEV